MILRHILISAIAGAALTVSASGPLYLETTAPLNDRVEDALNRMTLEEKVAMCHAQSKFSSPGVPRLGIPELWMSDGPHGVRAEINWNDWGYSHWTNDSCTVFPALTALAATWNPELSAAYGKALGEEARYRGKDVILGPGVNIYRTPLNGRNFEYMGEDPYLAGVMVVPYVKAVQECGVATCVKHYALNNQEQWRGHIDVEISPRALYEIYLPAFEKAVVDGGTWTIMGAYNKVGGQHACHNEMLLNDILKRDWGFDGAVITDWGGAHDTREAALNGLDLEMGTYTNGLTSESAFGYDDYYLGRPFREMLQNGEISEEVVNDKARRVLRTIMRTAMNTSAPFGSLNSPEHLVAAKAIGDESVVLLKNAPLGRRKPALLPLDPASAGRVLVVGDNAVRRLNEGGGSSELKAKTMVSPLEAITAVYGADNVKFARGYAAGKAMYGRAEKIPQSVTDSLRAEAVAMARDADVVIFVGGLNKNAFQDCESHDRLTYDLPFGQPELIEALAEACPRTAVVLLSGNAVAMPWLEKVPAVMQGWYLGSMGGSTIADVLSGAVNPSGKLPFSFPRELADCGAHSFGPEAYPGDSITVKYLDDIYVGYRWHDTKKRPALFPFGHGLSYTTFTVGEPRLSSAAVGPGETVTVTVPVTNTGKKTGAEVVQLYVADERGNCPLDRPVQELKGFAKVNLAPGETREVTIPVDTDAFRYYDPEKGWTVAPGVYTLRLGTSSTDIKRRAEINVKS